MLRPIGQIGLPRRVVGFYLLFCLLAIGMLTLGAVLAVRSLLCAQATDGALSRIGRLAAAIELDHVKTGGENTQTLLGDAASAARFAYAGVAGTDGRYRAHTSPSLVGSPVLEPIGSALSWGAIDGVRFRDEHDRLVSEYATELSADDHRVGSLRVAVAEPGRIGTLLQFGRYATLAVLGPMLCVGLGGVWLLRQTAPVAEVESRLARLADGARGERPRLERVEPSGLACVGWNRLVDHLAALSELEAAADPGHKLAQQANRSEDRRTRDALESLAEGVAITDAQGRVEFANRAVEALLGLDERLDGSEILARLEAVSPPGAERLRGAAPASQVVVETPIDCAGERTLRVERAPLRSSGDAAGHVWTIRDITQQKLVEASRDQFIDTATHELRTPLSNIKAYAETLADGDFNDAEQQKEFCNTINTEATRLARFVDDLLSISSIETGSLGVDRQAVNVRRLADEAADKVRPLMKAGSIALEVKLAEKLGEARLDKDKVSGLLVNLLGNAAKYSPAGSTVTFTAVRKDDQLLFEVRDTGVGIAEEEQEKVFEKFFRSANPEVRDRVGTGLGLPLAREIARLHRGDLTLQSELGQGSTFTVTLPVS